MFPLSHYWKRVYELVIVTRVMPQPVAARIPQGELLGIDRKTPPWPQADVLFTDDRWQQATVPAWCRYRRGWAALMRWADGTED
jgi:hypothetical protein